LKRCQDVQYNLTVSSGRPRCQHNMWCSGRMLNTIGCAASIWALPPSAAVLPHRGPCPAGVLLPVRRGP